MVDPYVVNGTASANETSTNAVAPKRAEVAPNRPTPDGTTPIATTRVAPWPSACSNSARTKHRGPATVTAANLWRVLYSRPTRACSVTGTTNRNSNGARTVNTANARICTVASVWALAGLCRSGSRNFLEGQRARKTDNARVTPNNTKGRPSNYSS